MKTRQFFVANSSSSSFIVGMGYIVDRNKFNEWTNKNNITFDNYQFSIREPSFVKEDYNSPYIKNNRVILKGDKHISIPYDPTMSELFIMEIFNHEGDDEFWDGYDMNYDIELDYFDETYQNIYTEMSDESISGLKNVYKEFGAERIG